MFRSTLVYWRYDTWPYIDGMIRDIQYDRRRLLGKIHTYIYAKYDIFRQNISTLPFYQLLNLYSVFCFISNEQNVHFVLSTQIQIILKRFTIANDGISVVWNIQSLTYVDENL